MPPLKDPDPRVGPTLDAISKGRSPGGLALSLDGTLLAWTLGSRGVSEIHLSEVASPGTKDRLVRPHAADSACADLDPLWSPDGALLAFLSTCAGDAASTSHQQQIFIWTRRTGELRQLTHIAGELDALAWAPDSRQIGFLFVENATRSAGALAAMKPWSGVVGEDGVEVQRVAVARISGGEVTQVTPPNLHIYEWDWSPSSREITYVAANPPGENNWWIAKLFAQTIGNAATPRVVFDPNSTPGDLHGLQLANPRFSPDGKRIAFIAGLMSDQGSTGGDIFEIPVGGSASARDILPDKSVSPAWFEFSGRNTIRYVARKSGGNLISTLNAETGQEVPGSAEFYAKAISAGSGRALTSSRNGTYAFTASSFDNPPEIFLSRGPKQPLRQLSHINEGLEPVWGKSESIQWDNGGFHVQGMVALPGEL